MKLLNKEKNNLICLYFISLVPVVLIIFKARPLDESEVLKIGPLERGSLLRASKYASSLEVRQKYQQIGCVCCAS